MIQVKEWLVLALVVVVVDGVRAEEPPKRCLNELPTITTERKRNSIEIADNIEQFNKAYREGKY